MWFGFCGFVFISEWLLLVFCCFFLLRRTLRYVKTMKQSHLLPGYEIFIQLRKPPNHYDRSRRTHEVPRGLPPSNQSTNGNWFIRFVSLWSRSIILLDFLRFIQNRLIMTRYKIDECSIPVNLFAFRTSIHRTQRERRKLMEVTWLNVNVSGFFF